MAGDVPAGQPLTLHLASTDPGTHPGGSSVRGLVATGVLWATGPAGCLGHEYALGSLVYESTLANHLDVAVNSTRGAWWVDAAGVVQVRACRHTSTTTALQLSDQPGAAHSYVGLQHAYDTAGLVNELVLDNRGRMENPDEPGTYLADDRTLGPFRDHTSIATNGPRAGDVATALAYPAAGRPMYYGQADALAGEYLAASAPAEPFPTEVRLYRDPKKVVPPIDLMDPVELQFRGTTYHTLVAGIRHDIDPGRWHTTLTLVER